MTFYLDYFSLMSPTWVAQDVIVFLLTGGFLFFVMKKHAERAPYLFLELIALTIYASIYENMAVTQFHLYSYGPSLLMIGNVPISIPLFEGLVTLCALALLDYMRVPGWVKPVIVGFFAVLQDLSLDPVAVSQIFPVGGSVSGRWQWLIVQPGMASMFNEPIYNWSGWFLFTFLASSFLLIGRWWFAKSKQQPVVGLVYPFAAVVAALVALMSPLSRLMLWLEPFFAQGSASEWFMLVFYLLFPAALLLFAWKGRMVRSMRWNDTWLFFGILILLHVSDIVFAIIGGYWNTLFVVLGSSLIHAAVLAAIFVSGQRQVQPAANADDQPAALVSFGSWLRRTTK
ncbi:MAG: carotenoid biosynthesis protein [Anaerolineae bacterium]